jgi:hypothetical protein
MDTRCRTAENAIYYQNNYKEKAYKKYWEEGGREKAALRYRGLLKTEPVKKAEEVIEVVKTVQKYVKEIVISFD